MTNQPPRAILLRDEQGEVIPTKTSDPERTVEVHLPSRFKLKAWVDRDRRYGVSYQSSRWMSIVIGAQPLPKAHWWSRRPKRRILCQVYYEGYHYEQLTSDDFWQVSVFGWDLLAHVTALSEHWSQLFDVDVHVTLTSDQPRYEDD